MKTSNFDDILYFEYLFPGVCCGEMAELLRNNLDYSGKMPTVLVATYNSDEHFQIHSICEYCPYCGAITDQQPPTYH